MSDVPPEVIAEIFTHLPAKPLLRFRCVSKSFRVLIDSTDFIESHLDRTLKSTSQRNIILKRKHVYSIELDSLCNPHLLYQPGKISYFGTEIVGHSNGLLCVLAGQDVFIWNSWSRVHKKLPGTEIEFPDNSSLGPCRRINYGFGYDGINDDYKVVRIVPFVSKDENEVKVYSVKSDSWRRIKDFPYLFRKVHGVLVSGALHWVVTRDDDQLIASLDIATEEYRLIPQPEYVEMGFHMNVGHLGGKLTARYNYNMIYVDIWVMNNYGVRESWTKLISVAQYVDPSLFQYLRPIAYSKDGEKVLLERNGNLLWYDLKLKVLKNIRISGVPQFMEAFVCIQSLVKLPGGAKTVVH